MIIWKFNCDLFDKSIKEPLFFSDMVKGIDRVGFPMTESEIPC